MYCVVAVAVHWNKLPKEVESSSETCKSHLDMVLGNLLKVALLEPGVKPGDLQRSFPASAVL